MDELNRTVAKRQIARLLGGSTCPIYVVAEDGTIVFANDALAHLINRPVETLLGLPCDNPFPRNDHADNVLADNATSENAFSDDPWLAHLALPVNWSRSELRVMPFRSEKVEFQSESKSWLRTLIPLDYPDLGCVLCIWSESTHSDEPRWIDEPTSQIHLMLAESRERFAGPNALWYLQGRSALSARALEQIQVAIGSHHATLIVGLSGTGRHWLAQTIHACRRKRAPLLQSANAFIRIECALMDCDLLASMLEMVDENKRDGALQPTVVLDSLESLPVDCIPILVSYLRKKHPIHWIATCSPSFVAGEKFHRDSRTSGDAELEKAASLGREEILLHVGTIRIDLPSLTQRIDDMRAIVIAWMCVQPSDADVRMEFSEAFLDALSAYPWPGEIEELDATLRMAFTVAQGDYRADGRKWLEDKHLPVNVRTSVSHVEKLSTIEPVDLDAILEDVERTMIMRAIERFPTNKTAAAKLLNISRARLLRRLQQWGVQVESESKDTDDELPVFKELE